ncbi:MAG: hypothetical protein HYW48_03780 [Deltaproteobacteria bacterium]|nr:hypothetical protein [Deltaproteobacteria bacterium]
MKKQTALKYPHAASLFMFCRRVLDHKFSGIRVIDQDIGQILGFDPADCSHWKKGKKNIHSIHSIHTIAQHLGVDDKLVAEVACGELDDEEAYCEFLGYGQTSIDPKLMENAKKEFYKFNSSRWSRDLDSQFRETFLVNETKIDKIVNDIHDRLNFREAPLYLPELAAFYPAIVLSPSMDRSEPTPFPVTVQKEQNKYIIVYRPGSEIRPYVRYKIAKAVAGYFLPSRSVRQELQPLEEQLCEVESNLFASRLLAPTALIKKETKNINVAKDLLTQLAEIFWVSKSFMNRRLQEVLLSL